MALLELRGISKRYKDVLALDGVSFTLEPGEVLAVVGENGAGKSTLAKVLGGVLRPDAGELLVDGKPVRLATPMEAFARGVGAVHQGSHLLDRLTVGENLMLGREVRARLGFIDERASRAEATRIAASTGLDLDPRAPVESVPEAEQRVVELARVMTREGRVLVLDEPTEQLGPREQAWFVRTLRELRAAGRAFVLVSHDMAEVLSLADRVLVLREGAVVAMHRTAGLDAGRLAEEVAGRTLPATAGRPATAAAAAAALSVNGLTLPGEFEDVSFALAPGQILGLAGRPGDGRAALLRALVGRRARRLRGELALSGKKVRISSPTEAIRHGLALVTQRRRSRGLVLELNLEEETFFSQLGGVASGWLMGSRERDTAGGIDFYVKDLATPEVERSELWKWMHGELPRVVLFDGPTRGAAPGSRAALHALLRDLAGRGRAVVVTSPDRTELEQLCDRVLTFAEHRLAG